MTVSIMASTVSSTTTPIAMLRHFSAYFSWFRKTMPAVAISAGRPSAIFLPILVGSGKPPGRQPAPSNTCRGHWREAHKCHEANRCSLSLHIFLPHRIFQFSKTLRHCERCRYSGRHCTARARAAGFHHTTTAVLSMGRNGLPMLSTLILTLSAGPMSIMTT